MVCSCFACVFPYIYIYGIPYAIVQTFTLGGAADYILLAQSVISVYMKNKNKIKCVVEVCSLPQGCEGDCYRN